MASPQSPDVGAERPVGLGNNLVRLPEQVQPNRVTVGPLGLRLPRVVTPPPPCEHALGAGIPRRLVDAQHDGLDRTGLNHRACKPSTMSGRATEVISQLG